MLKFLKGLDPAYTCLDHHAQRTGPTGSSMACCSAHIPLLALLV